MLWNKYTINTTTAMEDLVCDMLAELGITEIEIDNKVPLTKEDLSDMFVDFVPDLGPDDGKSRVSFYTKEGSDDTSLLDGIREGLKELEIFGDIGEGSIEKEISDTADWQDKWKDFFHPFKIGNILIKPSWEDVPKEDSESILIEIDPGVSFGTGKHETTKLCIEQLQKHMRAGDKVLDLGCGSGILSIAALKLSAGEVNGVDIDKDCINSTRENMQINKLASSMGSFLVGNLIDDKTLCDKLGDGYDVVVANILAEVIIPMSPIAYDKLRNGGIFITSGIIDFKEEEVTEAIKAAGFTVLEINHDGEWVNITARK